MPDEFRAGKSAYRQSDNEPRYQAALERLAEGFRVYACDCSRKDITGESDLPDQETRYPGKCRDRKLAPGPGRGLRVVMDEGEERFDDGLLGPQRQDPSRQCGDLLLKDRHGNWTYQFAVTVDDLDQGIDLVIRGQDLLESTGRQMRSGPDAGAGGAPGVPAPSSDPAWVRCQAQQGQPGHRRSRPAGRRFHPGIGAGAGGAPLRIDRRAARSRGSGVGPLLFTELASTMPRTGRWLAAGLLLCALAAPARASAQLPRVMIQTELGSMEVEVDTIQAPDDCRQLPHLRRSRRVPGWAFSSDCSGRAGRRKARPRSKAFRADWILHARRTLPRWH